MTEERIKNEGPGNGLGSAMETRKKKDLTNALWGLAQKASLGKKGAGM